MVSNTSIFLTQVNKYLGLTRSSSQPLFPKNTIPTKRSNSALSTLLGTNTGTITAGTIIGWYVSIRPYCHQINQIKTEIFLTPSCRRFQAAYFIKNFLRETMLSSYYLFNPKGTFNNCFCRNMFSDSI